MPNRAYITLPIEVLVGSIPGLMHLPPGTKVTSPRCEGSVSVFIEHPDLPEIEEGTRAPEVSPVWERDETGRIDWHIIS